VRASALRALAGGRRGALDEALRVFGSERDLVLAAHARWQTHLLARLDAVLENGSDDPHDDVLRAVEDLGRAMPGIAALLREHAHDPVLDRARRRLADYVGRACPCGRPHPLVAPAAPVRSPASCAVRRGLAHLAGLVAEHCRHRPAVRYG
jgi:hypothetical protein